MTDCVNPGCAAKETCLNDMPGVKCYGYEPKPQTNYDLIISKTPEELAENFASRCCPLKDQFYNCGKINKKDFSWEDCKSCWLDWLRREASDGS